MFIKFTTILLPSRIGHIVFINTHLVHVTNSDLIYRTATILLRVPSSALAWLVPEILSIILYIHRYRINIVYIRNI